MKQIVAVLGDYYHAPEGIEQALSKAFIPISTDYSLEIIDRNMLSHALSKNPATVVLYQENRVTPQEANPNLWMSADIADDICRYVKAGGSWFAWHAGMASYPTIGTYTDMLRGYFDWHPKENSVVSYTPLDNANGRPVLHPIIDGIKPFDFIDEHYFVHLHSEETTVFLNAESTDGQSVAGWAHPFGQGRVCCITPAHHAQALLDPEMQALITRALQWCVRIL